jgi:ferric-dicitrate binding protein FerR (iron transport regulator)
VKAMGEELRDPIFGEVRGRIRRASRRTLRMRIAVAAASVALVLGLTGYFSYQEGYRQQKNQLVEMMNPLGMKSSVILPDGSKVLLNAGTVLRYPSAFVSGKREVEVDGEAFFEVTHDAGKQFVVKSGEISVKVFGTLFNVKSYKEDPTVEITLVEGKVGVGLLENPDLVYIHPEYQFTFEKGSNKYVVHKVDIDQYTGWRDGKFHFRNLKLAEIVKQLERSFNVKIHIASDCLKNTLFTGDFVNGENINQILRVMTADRRMNYRMEKDQIYIEESKELK